MRLTRLPKATKIVLYKSCSVQNTTKEDMNEFMQKYLLATTKNVLFQMVFVPIKFFFKEHKSSNNDNNNNNGYDKNSQERFEWELCCYTCSRQHNGLEIIWELFCKLLCYLHHRRISCRISDLLYCYDFIIETSMQIFKIQCDLIIA